MLYAYHAQGQKTKREKVLASGAYPYLSERKIFPQILPLPPSRHPLLHLALELDHMATLTAREGSWECFEAASSNYLL